MPSAHRVVTRQSRQPVKALTQSFSWPFYVSRDNTLPLMWPFIEVTLAADMSVLNSSAYAYCKYTWIHRPDALLLAAQLVCTDVCMRPM